MLISAYNMKLNYMKLNFQYIQQYIIQYINLIFCLRQ